MGLVMDVEKDHFGIYCINIRHNTPKLQKELTDRADSVEFIVVELHADVYS